MNLDNKNEQNNLMKNNTYMPRRSSFKFLKKIIIEFGEKNKNLSNNNKFGNNIIKTTKYNVITLVPKSLFYQLCRASNIYFLCVSILNCLSFSPKNPISMIATFSFVLIFTMGKDAILDYGRHKQDQKSNSRNCLIYLDKKWKKSKCYTIIPGNIIKLKEDEECSCDILIIKSSNKNGYLYVDTKNLDGESNLKEKCSVKDIEINKDELSNLSGNILTTVSDENLNEWEGHLNYNEIKDIYCSMDNMMLKGTILKNTEYIYGIVIYSGHQTKIMKNSHKPEPKVSKMIKTMDKLLYSLFAFTLLLCLIFAFLCNKFQEDFGNKYDYIFINYDIINKGGNKAIKIIKYFIIFFIDYYQIIPISLYVVMEIIKLYQNILISYDFEIYDLINDKPAESRDTGLIEQLGQIDFLFSDKTGTLTLNQMQFKKCFINGKIYGAEKESNECTDAVYSINGDMSAYELLIGATKNSNEKQEICSDPHIVKQEKIWLERFFLLLCVCNEVFPTLKEDKICYQSTSPDDIALVKGAQQLGFEFQYRNYNNLTIKNYINHNNYNFEVLISIPFNSNRKRMTVLTKDTKKDKYYVFSKGSDSVMTNDNHDNTPLITIYGHDRGKKKLDQVLEHFSMEGLRILVMGYKEVSESQANEWKKRYFEAIKSNSSKKDIYSEIEKDLIFCGCSAIEDKLQDGVPETIKTLIDCGIRIWVLTGDKKETAIEISKQCNLVAEAMTLIDLTQKRHEYNLLIKLKNLCKKYNLNEFIDKKCISLDEIQNKVKNDIKIVDKDISVIIDGVSLHRILSNKELGRLFFLLGVISKSVICCRISPKQKSLVVDLIKSNGDFITLAIGDGANDIPMIMEASIGIGIQGKEGIQAVRSSDYSIGQFKFLEKLILFYGRNGYTKIAKYISYYFYKNFILVVTELIFSFYNGFSGQIFFPDWYGTMFNAIFTSWPCIFVFAYEKELSVKICKKFPILYRAGPKNYYFNLKTFWTYIIYALIHSILCFIIPAYGLRNIINDKGDTMNNWKISTVSFSMVIHVVSIKLLLISNFWNWFSIIFTILSIILYYMIIICLCTYAIGSVFQPESIGAFSVMVENFPSIIILIFGPFVICLPDIIIKQINFTFFPTPTEYLQQYLKDEDFLKMMDNKNISTNDKGKVIFKKISRRYTKGFKYLQERLAAFRNQYKANSTMDVNLINKLKLDISSNNENQENSINPLQYPLKSRALFSKKKKLESDKFILEREVTKKNYEFLFRNSDKRNSLQVLHGPNDIMDKNNRYDIK